MARTNRNYTPEFDITLGDPELALAREDIRIGRWQGLDEILAVTWHHWDWRTHRMRLLAQAAAGTAVAEEWHTAQPDNHDALVLRAETEVMRVFNLAVAAGGAVEQHRLDQALQICLRAAEAVPEDPTPWVSLLTIARLFPGGHRDVDRWWHELQLRDPYNREAHHQVLRYTSARWHGSHGSMYNFARDVVSSLPPGSPLAVLLQVARAEEYRYRLEHEGDMALGLGGHWRSDVATADTRRTWTLWIDQWDGVDRPHDLADLHYLLHAACFGGLDPLADQLFKVVGTRAAPAPWSYFGDPGTVITQWHTRVVG